AVRGELRERRRVAALWAQAHRRAHRLARAREATLGLDRRVEAAGLAEIVEHPRAHLVGLRREPRPLDIPLERLASAGPVPDADPLERRDHLLGLDLFEVHLDRLGALIDQALRSRDEALHDAQAHPEHVLADLLFGEHLALEL